MKARPYLFVVLVLAAGLLASCSFRQETRETDLPGPSLKAPAVASGLPPAQGPGDGGFFLNGAPDKEVEVRLDGTDAPPGAAAEETMYPVSPRYRVSRHVDHGRTTWTVRGIPGPFVLERYSQGRVFITRQPEKAGQEADQVEISEELRLRGLDGEFNLSQVETQYVQYGVKNFFNFQLSDGENWVLFSSRWEGGKHLQTVPLHQFGIVDTAFTLLNYESDRYDFLDGYLKQEGEKNYLLTWDERAEKLTSYALPPELGPIRDAFGTPRYGERAVYLVAAASAAGGEEMYVYRLDLAAGVLTRGQALVEWAAEYPPQWRFTGDLACNYLVGGNQDTLLVLGDDGAIGGFHESTYLYGVDRRTGRERWSVYGGFEPIQFSMDAGGKTVTVAVKPEGDRPPRVMRRELASGRVLWEKQPQEWEDYYDFGVAGSGETAFLYLSGSGTSPKGKLVALSGDDGRVLWEKELLAGQRLLASYRPLPMPILVGQDQIEGLDPRTGRPAWRLEVPVNPDDPRANFARLRVIEDPRCWGGEKETDRYWFATADRFLLVDLKSGEVLHSLANNGNRVINVLDEDHLLVRDFAGPLFRQGLVTSGLYSLAAGKVLWSRDDDIQSALLAGDRLYYTTGQRVAAVDLGKGEQAWSIPFAVPYAKQPMLLGTRLVVPGKKGIFVFDSRSGRFLHQVADLELGAPEARNLLNYYGFLTRLEDGLYAGSSNGYLQLFGVTSERIR